MEDHTILRSFADNQLLVEAVRKFILNKFSMEQTGDLFGLEDKQIGEIVRARLDGRAKVEQAFSEIAQYKTVISKVGQINPAR